MATRDVIGVEEETETYTWRNRNTNWIAVKKYRELRKGKEVKKSIETGTGVKRDKETGTEVKNKGRRKGKTRKKGKKESLREVKTKNIAGKEGNNKKIGTENTEIKTGTKKWKRKEVEEGKRIRSTTKRGTGITWHYKMKMQMTERKVTDMTRT